MVLSNTGDQLIGDFEDILGLMSNVGQIQQAPAQSAIPNLLDDDLESIIDIDTMVNNTGPTSLMNTMTSLPVTPSTPSTSNQPSLDDLFGDLTMEPNASSLFYSSDKTLVLPKEVNTIVTT